MRRINGGAKTGRIVLAALLISLVAGCGGGGGGTTAASATTEPMAATTSATATTTTLPSGFGAFVDTADQFSIDVPAVWHQIDPTTTSGAAALQKWIALNPSLATLGKDAASLVAVGIKYLAIAPTAGAGYVSRVIVFVKSLPGGTDADLATVVDGIKSGYKDGGITVISSSYTTLDGHKAYQTQLTAPAILNSGQKTSVPLSSLTLIAHQNVYEVAFGGTDPKFPTIRSTFALL